MTVILEKLFVPMLMRFGEVLILSEKRYPTKSTLCPLPSCFIESIFVERYPHVYVNKLLLFELQSLILRVLKRIMQMICFTNWLSVLEASALSERQRHSYLVTIRWYLSYLKRHKQPATVETARAFIEHEYELRNLGSSRAEVAAR